MNLWREKVIFACVMGTPRALVAHRMLLFSGVFGCGGARDASGSGAAGVKTNTLRFVQGVAGFALRRRWS